MAPTNQNMQIKVSKVHLTSGVPCLGEMRKEEGYNGNPEDTIVNIYIGQFQLSNITRHLM